jgi:hypothetical protein
MRNKILILVIAMLALVAGVLLVRPQRDSQGESQVRVDRSEDVRPAVPPTETDHNHSTSAAHVPAYQTVGQIDKLEPTLQPARFMGKARDAYVAAQKIPKTLAQLPCYCHCDQSFGHKSLHSCFVDDHASQCAVCVDEALLAYQLEKSGKTASQIREQIIAQYATH